MSAKTINKVVFISNYFNHHQKPFSDAIYKLLGEGYKFIETTQMPAMRISLGYGDIEKPVYVIKPEEALSAETQAIVDLADVVIIGSASDRFIANRIKDKKIVFRYSERPLKRGFELWKYPIRFYRWHRANPQGSNIYMLCASAYTASDYAKFGLFKNKCYKWGYFPELKQYDDISILLKQKKQGSILWCARFVDWKHPEIPLVIAKRLKKDGYNFTINMIGNGEMESVIAQKVVEDHMEDCIHMLGSMKPEQVRDYMEKSEIFMFTSDRNEGWGAVLNESMNAACAVVASHAIGSVPFLIQQGENGLVYKDGDLDDLYTKVKLLLDDHDKTVAMGTLAYETISNVWNAKVAAIRFIQLADTIMKGECASYLFKAGVCSKASILIENYDKQ